MEILSIAMAFGLGFVSRLAGFPPLIGYLAAGFILKAFNVEPTPLLDTFASVGITLLLFCIGLKLEIKKLLNPQIFISTTLHMGVNTAICGCIFFLFGIYGLFLYDGLSLEQAALLGFAASFSSTVCAIKVMDDKGELSTRHGDVTIALLVLQDIIAVIFLTLINNKIPSLWALILLGLPALRYPLLSILKRVGHDELLCLVGFLLAFGGGWLFNFVGLKADLGALVFGMLIANTKKSSELYSALSHIKELFLICFFLSIGFHAGLTIEIIASALCLCILVTLKGSLYFLTFTQMRFRARTSVLATLNLFNFSEFGLIVATIGYNQGLLSATWIVVLALTIAFSFIINIILNNHSHELYKKYRTLWLKFESPYVLPCDEKVQIGNKDVIILGMGKIGEVVYDTLAPQFGNKICGLDTNKDLIQEHLDSKRNVLFGDGTSIDLWEQQKKKSYKLIVITAMKLQDVKEITKQLRSVNYTGKISAIAQHEDEKLAMEKAGVDIVFDYHEEAGLGYAHHAITSIG